MKQFFDPHGVAFQGIEGFTPRLGGMDIGAIGDKHMRIQATLLLFEKRNRVSGM